MAQGKLEKLRSLYHKAEPKADRPLIFVTLLTLALGLIMMYSAGFANALYYHSDSYWYIGKQLMWAGLGIAAMFIISMFPLEVLRVFVWPAYVVSELLLWLTLTMEPINGARRWIIIGTSTFQPSELSKAAVILLFAHFVALAPERMRDLGYGFFLPMGILASIAAAMLLQSHVSGLIIIGLIGVTLLLVGGSKVKWYAISIAVAVPAGVSFLFFAKKMDYAWARIQAWLNPESLNSYHTRQSLVAIGSGGLTGLGIGNSRQKHLFLPEPQNDFIFSVICEEMGFIGGLIVILLFAFFVYRGIKIAMQAKTRFRMMVAVGVTAQVALQALLHIAVTTNLLPNTGISLPFFSAGGSQLFILLAEVGMLISASRGHTVVKIQKKAKKSKILVQKQRTAET